MNDDLRLTLTCFMAMSNLTPNANGSKFKLDLWYLVSHSCKVRLSSKYNNDWLQQL